MTANLGHGAGWPILAMLARGVLPGQGPHAPAMLLISTPIPTPERAGQGSAAGVGAGGRRIDRSRPCLATPIYTR